MCPMAAPGQAFTLRIARDSAIEALSLVAACGGVVCAGLAGGVEMAGGVALLSVWMRPGGVADRYTGLRFDGDRWTVVGAQGRIIAIDPPVVHLAHRALVVLEVLIEGRSEIAVFSRSTTPANTLRRLRVRLRAGRSTN